MDCATRYSRSVSINQAKTAFTGDCFVVVLAVSAEEIFEVRSMVISFSVSDPFGAVGKDDLS